MEPIPQEIQGYGTLGLLGFLLVKEVFKPILDSFIKRGDKQVESEIESKKREQDILYQILTDSIKRIPDGIDNLRDSIQDLSSSFATENRALHKVTHEKLDLIVKNK